MRRIFRLLGWLLVIFALALLAVGAWDWGWTGEFRFLATGELWYRLDRGSLNLVQAITQRYLSPWLWDPVVTNYVLLQPAALVLGLPGAILLLLTRGRRERRRRGRIFD
ncbi:MAG: hypothetical protein HYR63_10855 [Proteobacteria bacterium]|nr:hypothetical protein [Pseudomonadota bacterium]MBI3498277.1 hypothetical protein [Pseudomonadota bacterium]